MQEVDYYAGSVNFYQVKNNANRTLSINDYIPGILRNVWGHFRAVKVANTISKI